MNNELNDTQGLINEATRNARAQAIKLSIGVERLAELSLSVGQLNTRNKYKEAEQLIDAARELLYEVQQ